MKRKIVILLSIVAFVIIAFFSARYYAYHGGKRDVQSEEAAFTISAKNITEEFAANADASNKKYLEKPVAISGAVTSVSGTEVILDNSVNCNFLKPDTSIKNGQNVTIKGRVVGFDDLLGEVKMDQCNLNK